MLVVSKVGGIHHSDGCPVMVLLAVAGLADVGLVCRSLCDCILVVSYFLLVWLK